MFKSPFGIGVNPDAVKHSDHTGIHHTVIHMIPIPTARKHAPVFHQPKLLAGDRRLGAQGLDQGGDTHLASLQKFDDPESERMSHRLQNMRNPFEVFLLEMLSRCLRVSHHNNSI